MCLFFILSSYTAFGKNEQVTLVFSFPEKVPLLFVACIYLFYVKSYMNYMKLFNHFTFDFCCGDFIIKGAKDNAPFYSTPKRIFCEKVLFACIYGYNDQQFSVIVKFSLIYIVILMEVSRKKPTTYQTTKLAFLFLKV